MWLLASKGRSEKLKYCLERCVNAGMTSPGVVIIDNEDPTKDEYHKLKLPNNWTLETVYRTEDEPIVSQGKSIREWMRIHKDYVDACEWIGFFGDDHLPVTQEWDKRLIASTVGQFRVVAANDQWLAPKRLTGPTIWSGDLVRLVGYIYPKGMNHMFVDNVWEIIGLNTGVWATHMGVYVEHEHWTKKPTVEPDETTKYLETFLQRDKDRCEEWMVKEAGDIIVKILSLKDKKVGVYNSGIHILM